MTHVSRLELASRRKNSPEVVYTVYYELHVRRRWQWLIFDHTLLLGLALQSVRTARTPEYQSIF